ncbi:MAG: histidinol dehydrogenase [Bacteroidota bacterium]|nr:histidinol dehydrogenase [Bacteroidota bacterium]
MHIIEFPKSNEWHSLVKRPIKDLADIEQIVVPILDDIKINGDKALLNYVKKFDSPGLTNLLVSENEVNHAISQVDSSLKQAINVAKSNIEKFHSAQKQEIQKIETTPGVVCWRKNVAIDKVGLYIPGGTAPLFSTVLMLAIPATIAGCKEIILVTPANTSGNVHPAILYTASICGINKIFKAGGAQAIGALAFGTDSIPKCDKIFGPGNQYVMAAKQLVQKDGTAIDMPAGPSEVLVIADETAHPSYVAADLLSQAEHGNDSQVILVATNKDIANQVIEQTQLQIKALPRIQMASNALDNSFCIILDDNDKIMEFVNSYAPEHLIIASDRPELFADKVQNAGSVFLGHYTPESAGDYASGTNHTLPTNGYARAYSGVSLDSFYKKITFQSISKSGLQNIGPTIETMAAAEELQAHKNAVTIRLKDLK